MKRQFNRKQTSLISCVVEDITRHDKYENNNKYTFPQSFIWFNLEQEEAHVPFARTYRDFLHFIITQSLKKVIKPS